MATPNLESILDTTSHHAKILQRNALERVHYFASHRALTYAQKKIQQLYVNMNVASGALGTDPRIWKDHVRSPYYSIISLLNLSYNAEINESSHALNADDSRDVFRDYIYTAATCLESGGIIVFDFLNVDFMREQSFGEQHMFMCYSEENITNLVMRLNEQFVTMSESFKLEHTTMIDFEHKVFGFVICRKIYMSKSEESSINSEDKYAPDITINTNMDDIVTLPEPSTSELAKNMLGEDRAVQNSSTSMLTPTQLASDIAFTDEINTDVDYED